MKKTFTLLSLFTVLFCSAQPTFQYSNTVSPTAGATATVLLGSKPSSPGASGAGVTWNFSSLTFTAVGTASVVLPSATPFGSSFPGANSAAVIATPTSTFYTFENVQPTFQDQLGNDITATGGSTYTPDPKRHMTFPLTYGASYTDSYQCISCSPSSFTLTYDAYGTLIVNGKTYSNVARVTKMFGTPYYNYYSTNPILSIFAYDSSPTSSPTSFLLESSILSGISENYVVKHMTVYPNPASGSITLQNDNFVKVSFALYNILGKEVKASQELSQGEITKIDISNYSSGLYFIKYHDEFGNDSYTKLIVE
ncbi:MAG: T9SS type A sorting domain-containing protein [Bacteroidia bacterium]|nr:T9SS type A sorting domain-containing protein [Bacteroidia bacterium]